MANDRLVAKPVGPARIRLADLLRRVKRSNLHRERADVVWLAFSPQAPTLIGA